MAWIYLCVFYISLFQMSVQSYDIIRAPARSRSERSTSQKSNGSYKIINRYGKPFVNKRVPDGSVVFPGPTSRAGEDSALEIPEECKRIGICDVAPNTKDTLIENVIKDYERRNKTFTSDILEAPQIAERIGPSEENIELCVSSTRLYVPRLAQDSNNEWHRILNTNSSQRQKFRVDICREPNAPCASIAIFPDGYSSSCIQKYILREMVALNGMDEVVEKPFMVPSCCSCVVKAV